MKKSIFSKVGAAAMVLTLVTASLVGGTFAKYTSTLEGKATATVAQWKVDLTDGKNSLTQPIILKNENTNAGMTDGVVGPGAFGNFKLVVDGTGTQVDYEYKLAFDASKIKAPIKFYKGTDATGEEITSAGIPGETVEADAIDKKSVIDVYWVWDNKEDLTTDTSIGEAADGSAESVNITVTAEQVITTK